MFWTCKHKILTDTDNENKKKKSKKYYLETRKFNVCNGIKQGCVDIDHNLEDLLTISNQAHHPFNGTN